MIDPENFTSGNLIKMIRQTVTVINADVLAAMSSTDRAHLDEHIDELNKIDDDLTRRFPVSTRLDVDGEIIPVVASIYHATSCISGLLTGTKNKIGRKVYKQNLRQSYRRRRCD
jgi:hypothetical protein